ncbi:hypothetical protein [Paenibacillus sp. An7]|uniref:hypothetical protein n=1 Tax=Paenibacillus sp. An7 TaxID=2689577 RepID=UPI00135A13B2|nr:hypothetical protein [Paenibacillus sp. An7]
MIKYKYTIEYREDFNEVILDFDIDKSLENGYLISNSLGSDIFGDLNIVKEEVDKLYGLLLGKGTLIKSGGNVNLINSDKDFTTIEDIYSEGDEEDIICRVETIEFIKIILIWAKENFEYKKQRGVLTEEKAIKAINWAEQKWIQIIEFDSIQK